MTLRANLLVALAVFLFMSTVQADDDPLLPGVVPTDGDSKADTVFIGKVSKAFWGETEAGPLSLTVNASRIFRGKVGSPTVLIIGTNATRCAGYLMPEVGNSYLFFMIKSSAGANVYKVLPATDRNVTLTKKLISD